MRPDENSARVRAIWLIMVLIPLGAFGCGNTSAPAPTSENGRKSVEVALEAWKAGKPAGVIAGSNPSVSVTDHDWGEKQALAAFEILREEPSSADERKTKFVVKLTLGKPSTTKEVAYIVIGNGPSWVFREEDYAQSINMDDGGPKKGNKR
jgi:hypothetical protein